MMTRRLTVFLMCLGGFAAGCSKDANEGRIHVMGTVTFDGQPVPRGRIFFNPLPGNAAGQQGYAEIASGQYDTNMGRSKGPSPGPVEVKVEGLGEPTADYPNGRPLFLNFVLGESVVVPESGTLTQDVHVPGTARMVLPAKPVPQP